MKRFLTRWYLLNKRLFKKPVFVIILCMVPVLIMALNAVTAHSDGFIKIAVAVEDPDDATAVRIAAMLSDSSEIVHYTLCDTPEEAIDRVRYGEAGGAWIFRADIQTPLQNMVSGGLDRHCVRVVEREDTVALRLAREKLAAVLSSESCFALMCSAYAEKVSPDYDVTALRAHYDAAVGTGEIFEFRYASGELIDADDTSYLMLPIRGVLAAAILLCGMAMAMFWLHDEEKMVFCRVPRAARPAFELGYHLTGIIDVGVVVLVSLYAAGMGLSLLREVVSLAVYCLGCAVFVILIRRLLRGAGSVAAVTPLLIVAVLVVNPVLFNLPFVYPLRVMTPVHYYLQATHDPAFLWYGMLYAAAVGAMALCLFLFENRRRKYKTE